MTNYKKIKHALKLVIIILRLLPGVIWSAVKMELNEDIIIKEIRRRMRDHE